MALPSATNDDLVIVDIRRQELSFNLTDDIKRGLTSSKDAKILSTLVLYDQKGLQLFQEITYLDEYYLTNAEIEVLELYSEEIARNIPHGAEVVELGSG
jgi:uncharacterized SAM-dependent methyltransferase